MPSTGVTLRARARAELTAAILDMARRHLAAHGAADLSLRAVARDLGMASSAVYRYVASRDALLTALIEDAHRALGAEAERAESAVDRLDLPGRWEALAEAVHRWADAHPHEYALVYGTPVPGYRPPPFTVDGAGRVGVLVLRVLRDAHRAGQLDAARVRPATGRLAVELASLGAEVLDDDPEPLPGEVVAAGVAAWTHLFGTVSFAVFGQYDALFCEGPTYAAYAARQFAGLLGLAPLTRHTQGGTS